MADPIAGIWNSLMNGSTAGIPNLLIVIIIGLVCFIFYLLLTRSPKLKEFKPMDMKKETKRRFKREYKYFGMFLNKNIYVINDDKPCAYGIGYMKVVENKAMKRLEPVWSKFSPENLDAKHEQNAIQIYNKSYLQLTDVEKKNIDEVAKEELRYEKIEDISADENIKIRRGKKEIKYSVPVAMLCIKFCSPNLIAKVFARALGIGIDWALFNDEQIDFKTYTDRVLITANFQRRTPFDIFVFSREGKNLVQDISYGIERENIWQETANQIPRAVHFDTEASKLLLYRREDAKIEKEKRKAQTEAHEFG